MTLFLGGTIDANATIKEFEEAFNQAINDPEKEKEAAEILAKEEEQIKDQNAAYANGTSTFNETVLSMTMSLCKTYWHCPISGLWLV